MKTTLKRLLRCVAGLLIAFAMVLGVAPRMALATVYYSGSKLPRDLSKGDVLKDGFWLELPENNQLIFAGYGYKIKMDSQTDYSVSDDTTTAYGGPNMAIGIGESGVTYAYGNYFMPYVQDATATAWQVVSVENDSVITLTGMVFVDVSNITLDPNSLSLTMNSDATPLTATVSPDTATDQQVKWSVTAGADKVKLYSDSGCKDEVGSQATTAKTVYAKGVAAGNATIKVESSSDSTKYAECSTTVTERQYAVSVTAKGETEGAGGTASASPTSCPEGTVVTLTATPNEGCELEKWEVTSGEGASLSGDKLTIGTSDVSVTAIFKTKPTKPTYTATSGAGSTWTKDSGKDLAVTFKRTAEGEETDTTFRHFVSASVDGKQLTKGEAYEAKEGSAVITLKPAYLQTLDAGKHTLTATFDDGSADADLTVAEPASTKVSITFDANGGSGKMDPLSAEAGSKVTLTENKFTRSGYTFNGWNTQKDGKGTSYKDKDTVELKEDMTLYAQWTKKTSSSSSSKNASSSSKNASSSSMTASTSSSSKSGLANTGDAASIAPIAMMAVAGAGFVFAGRKRR